MPTEVLKLKFLQTRNCFLHVTHKVRAKLGFDSVVPVKMTKDDGGILYFSATSSHVANIEHWEVGINSNYAERLSLTASEMVSLEPVCAGSVQSITASPVSKDDLEITESSSDLVEANLLSQLRVVWPGQTFVFWISPSVPVHLFVESILPDTVCGLLKEESEIHVSCVTRQRTNTLEDVCKHKINRPLIFRSALYGPEDQPSLKEDLLYHPYDVFVRSSMVPDWLIQLVKKGPILCGVRPFLDVENRDEGWENTVVRLSFVKEDFKGLDLGSIPSIFISPSLARRLKVTCGAKVVLKCMRNTNHQDIRGIIVETDEDNRSSICDTLHKALIRTAASSGSILVNTKGDYPMRDGSTVSLTLRPLDVRWGLLSMANLREISFTCAQHTPTRKETPEAKVPSPLPYIRELLLTAEKIMSSFNPQNNLRGIRFFPNTIITGKPGSGKKTFLEILFENVSRHPFYLHTRRIDCSCLKGKKIELVSKILQESLDVCSNHQPSVLALTSIDKLGSASVPDQDKSDSAFSTARAALKIHELVESYQLKNDILVFASCESVEGLHPKLFSPRGNSTFSLCMEIPNLTKEDRCFLIKNVVRDTCIDLKDAIEHVDLEEAARVTDGFVAKDVCRFASKIVFEAWQRKGAELQPLKLTQHDVLRAFTDCLPSALQGCTFRSGSLTTFSKVGGLKSAKEKLLQIILWPSMYPEVISQCPLKQQTAVLIYGAPGCGKTYLASALAGESKLTLLSVKGPELISKYFGESEEGVRKIFEKAQQLKPCLLFFDEFDSLVPRRGNDNSGVSDRVVNQFLTALDGVEPLSGVLIIAATNRPDLIDPAILRPGRIGHSVYCEFPNRSDRLEILKLHCSNVPLSSDVNLEEIAELTEDYSPADLKGLISSTQLAILDSKVRIPSGQDQRDLGFEDHEFLSVNVTQEDLLKCLRENKPALNAKDRIKYETIYDNFRNRRPPDLSQKKVAYA